MVGSISKPSAERGGLRDVHLSRLSYHYIKEPQRNENQYNEERGMRRWIHECDTCERGLKVLL